MRNTLIITDTVSELAMGFIKQCRGLCFGGNPTDDQIRRQILITLYRYWKDDPTTNMLMEHLRLFVPVETKTFTRNILYLVDGGFIKVGSKVDARLHDFGIISVRIANLGITHIEDQSEFSIKVPSQVVYQKIIMGDHINASTQGGNSPIIINSHNVDIAFGQIKAEIENKITSDKQQILALVDQLNNELKIGKNQDKIKDIFGRLKEKAAWVNEKIISHPLLAQLVAQYFAKQIGIT